MGWCWPSSVIIRIYGTLVVRCHQVDLGEDVRTEKLVGVVMDMTDGVAVGVVSAAGLKVLVVVPRLVSFSM
jgi:hypothetical protein